MSRTHHSLPQWTRRCVSAVLAAGMLAAFMPTAALAEGEQTPVAQVELTEEPAQALPELAGTDEAPAADAPQQEVPDAADAVSEDTNDVDADTGDTTPDEAENTASPAADADLADDAADDGIANEDEPNDSTDAGSDTAQDISTQMLYNVNAVDAAASVTAAALAVDNETNSVFGVGILTGSGDFDTCANWNWDANDDKTTYRGMDAGVANNVVRSFDTVSYYVTSTVSNVSNTDKLVYEITLPKDDEITLDTDSLRTAESITTLTENNNVIYKCVFPLSGGLEGGSGQDSRTFVVNVGNKHQGDTIKPEIRVYLNEDADNAISVNNIQPVYVTSAPAYNIILKANTSLTISREVADFSKSNTDTCKGNASTYQDGKVIGYKQFYGFALEMARNDKGIRGVEFPMPGEPITFDIDISDYYYNGQKVSNDFQPLLYEVNPNRFGGAGIGDIPFTSSNVSGNNPDAACDNSGTVEITQNGTNLHVTVKDFSTNYKNFPKKNFNNKAYWQDSERILEAVFSAWSFTVVYPYKNENGKNLKDYGDTGTINVTAKAENLQATSVTNATVNGTETDTSDNEAGRSWTINASGQREQTIIYTDKEKWNDSYTPEQYRTDGDYAAAGATDLTFTVSFTQKEAGEASEELTDTPVAIDQLVLFDSSALDQVSLKHETVDYGFTTTVLYAKLKAGKGGHLTNDTMRTVTKDDFDYYTEVPADGCDAVLVQYRGAVQNHPNINLMTQFSARVRPNVTADKVYMVTAVTDVWTTSDFAGNPDTANLSSYDAWRTWAQSQNAADMVENIPVKNGNRIDHRAYYTVPTYVNGVYLPEANHKFSETAADALYIVPYKANVTKSVAQRESDDSEKTTYNVGKGHRFVDYCISSSLNYGLDVTPPADATTTVTLVDTLPKGETYIEGSAYWGGNYQSNFPQAGTVSGGQRMDPDVAPQADGTTILTWTIPGVKLANGPLPQLHYSCRLGDELYPANDVANLQQLTNTVTIQTTEDKRPTTVKNGNIATASISTVKDAQFFMVKRGNPYMELNDNAYYDLIVSNTQPTAETDLCVVDTLPSNGNANTVKKGQYTITKVTLDLKAINGANDFELWYTDNADYQNRTALQIDSSEVTTDNGWKQADYDTVGDTAVFKGEGLLNSWPTAIVYKDKELASNTVVYLHIEFSGVSAADDLLNNRMTIKSDNNSQMISTVPTQIVKRTLEGTVWVDKNKDGKIDGGETKLAGVKVTLLKKNNDGSYTEATLYDEIDENGNPKKNENVQYTDENGHYKFEGLPEGDYVVKFESSDGTDLGQYEVTKRDTAADKSLTSKVDPTTGTTRDTNDKLESGSITGITAPTLDDMVNGTVTGDWENVPGSNVWNLPHQNLGLTLPDEPNQPENPDTPKDPEKPTNPDKPNTPATPTPSPAGNTPSTPASGTPTPAPAAQPTATPAPAAALTIPHTADAMPLGMVAAALLLSLSAMAGLYIWKKRN